MVGLGMVTLGVMPGAIRLFRYSKSASWMFLAWRTLSITRITGGASSSVPSAFFTVTGMSVFTPPSCSRKALWK